MRNNDLTKGGYFSSDKKGEGTLLKDGGVSLK